MFFNDAFGLFEVYMTNGHSMVPNDTKYINLDKLRVRKVSHTEYLLVGEIDVLAELGNNFQVFNVTQFKISIFETIGFSFRLRLRFIKKLETRIKKQPFVLAHTSIASFGRYLWFILNFLTPVIFHLASVLGQ